MGGKGAHLGYLGWPAGRGSSRGLAGRQQRVDNDQDRRRASKGGAGEEVCPARRSGGRDDQILRRGTSEWRRTPF
jgi:hypothetical protein